MRRKPKGQKFRNLFARGDVIYYQRNARGQRIVKSCRTDDWDVAAAVRDAFEERTGRTSGAALLHRAPTLANFAQNYLEHGTHDLAARTRSDWHSYLREGGPIMEHFGALRLDEIDRPCLRDFWRAEVTGHKPKPRATRTGRAYFDVLSSVLAFAIDEGLIEDNPIPNFRETLRSRGRTKKGRAEAIDACHVRPIESAKDIDALLCAAIAEGETAHLFVTVMLNAGMRPR